MDEQELKAIGRVIEENNNWRARYTQLHEQFDDLKAERAALLVVLSAAEGLVRNAHSDKRGGFYVFTQRLEVLEQAIDKARALVGSEGGEE